MFKFLILFLIINQCYGFNLSPIPNYSLNLPPLTFLTEKTQSSYFGYQINLRRNSVMISAPRLPPILESQRDFQETGGLFKCNIQDQLCEPYIMDVYGGNVPREPPFHVMKKSHQWFGAAIDGESQESDSFIACAPNIITVLEENDTIYLFNGICYLSQDTFTNGTMSRVLAPLLVRRKLSTIVDNTNAVNYMFGQSGLSVHITENGEEVLIGAPGVLNWRGTVIRYKSPDYIDAPGMSRRNVDGIARSQKQSITRFDVEIANPSYWGQEDDSYLGYAVTSGYFTASTTKLLYVASAPQGNFQTGEVLLFDFAVHPSNKNDNLERTIKIYHKFVGTQMGEYFGNALLAADFDGDGLDDLAIGAPFYGTKSTYNSGKVYIFLNQGDMSFSEPSSLYSSIETNGQFGMTLAKLGDINHDGYSDIAVGAPYEENGKVYIYLGGRNGVSTKPSQIISAAADSITPNLFGLGLSKGVDIDNNGFNDFAIGSPNSEAVHVYRAYPVVKIIVTIIPEPQEIRVEVTRTKLKTCWRYEMTRQTTLPFNFDTKLTIKLDPQLMRAKFADNNLDVLENFVLTKNVDQCISSDLILSHSINDIFKPIQLEVHYELVKKFQEFATFCDDCVAINPQETAMAQNSIIFSTGCKEIRCVADLTVDSRVVDSSVPYILGSSRYITLEYTVKNLGETSYLPQIKIEIPRIATFYKIPLNCRQEDFIMYCDIQKGRPFLQNEQLTMLVLIGTTRLEGTELIIVANVSSNSDELNPSDNVREHLIPLAEFSEIEIFGQSSVEQISVEEIGLKEFQITHYFEILNAGPSNIKQISFIASIPVIYKTQFPLHFQTLTNLSSITTSCEYDGQVIEPIWSEPFNVTDGASSGSFHMVAVDSSHHGIYYDPSKHGQEYDLNPDQSAGSEATLGGNYEGMMSLHGEGGFNTYNRYTREIRTHHNVSKRSITKQFDTKFRNLPHNRMLYFNCTPTEDDQHHCIQAVFDIRNFRVSDKRIKVGIRFSIDLQKIDQLYTEARDMFIMVTSGNVMKNNDVAGNTMKIVNIEPFTIVTKYVKADTPIWAIIISIVVGILTLIILSYGLYRCGFFRRAKKEEMETIARQSQALASQGVGNNDTDDD